VLLVLDGNVSNSGSMQPGTSTGIGCIDVTGSFTQLGAGGLAIDVGGTGGACVGHDQLRITGAAALDGRLDVSLLNGFTPASPQQFQVMTYNTETGDFNLYNLPSGEFAPPVPGPTGLVLVAQ
jgi:hypothetical protein